VYRDGVCTTPTTSRRRRPRQTAAHRRDGEGATGKVFRALHQTLNIPVAVKILHSAELERESHPPPSAPREAQLLAQLKHPNIIRVWDFEDNAELPYSSSKSLRA